MSEDERERIAKEHYNIHDDGLKLEAELENKYDDIIDSGWDKLSDAGVDMNSEIQSISRIAHARKMSEVNDKMTKRITEHLNNNGMKTWEIQHQTLEDKLRSAANT